MFATTDSATLPLPLPLAPETTEIQGALLAAVHPQPVAAVTDTAGAAPDAAAFTAAGVSP